MTEEMRERLARVMLESMGGADSRNLSLPAQIAELKERVKNLKNSHEFKIDDVVLFKSNCIPMGIQNFGSLPGVILKIFERGELDENTNPRGPLLDHLLKYGWFPDCVVLVVSGDKLLHMTARLDFLTPYKPEENS